MKLVCDGFDLSEAVNKVMKATAIRSTNPILEGIKIKAEDDELVLSATDLELSIEKRIKADVKIEGETVVAGRFFSELIKKLNNEKIEITKNENENTIRIKYTDSEGLIQTMPVSEFPEIKKIESPEYVTIKENDLKQLINMTIFSAAYDDSRPILRGILIEVENNKINAVALDGYRMALCSKPLIKTTANLNFVIPARCLAEVSKILGDSENPVNILVQKNYIVINVDETIITTRLLDGDYINYKQVIPSNTNTVVTISKRYLEETIERTSLLARLNKNNLVTFDITETLMSVSSTSDMGNIKEKIAVNTKGKEMVVAFNARYFSECLKNINDEYININFTSPIAPCTITATENSEYLYLILPVRIVN